MKWLSDDDCLSYICSKKFQVKHFRMILCDEEGVREKERGGLHGDHPKNVQLAAYF